MNTNQHVLSVRANLIVYAILMTLLLLTIGAAYLDLGRLNSPLAMAIAVAKATLIVLFFMHARYSSRLTQIFAFSGLVWLGILIALTLSDFLGRGWIGVLGK